MAADAASPEGYDIITVGSATEDVMVRCSSGQVITLRDAQGEESFMAFEYGGKIHVDDMLISVGGGSVNTAITFARQGMHTAVVSKVGSDEPAERVKRRLEEVGARTHLLAYSDVSGTGYSTIITAFTGERTVLVHRGASRELSEEDIPWEELAKTQWLYVGALAGQSWRLYPKLARFADEHGIKLGLNLGTSQIDQGLEEYGKLLESTYIIFQNDEEMRRLTGIEEERGDRDEREMCHRLHDHGVDIVVITDGRRGARASDGKAYYTVPAFQTEVASTVGAGDAFGAGCISALWHDMTVPESLRLGAANAASVVSQAGANHGVLSWDAALQYVDEHSTR
ncbi:MAG: carbohydrate kinase family protein [Armatimonadota bacterium]|nr:carbohydrate kinase family protein [Armatimonadota bacterium]